MIWALAAIAGLLILTRHAGAYGPAEPVPTGGLAPVWRWRAEAVRFGGLHGVDPAVLLAIIDQESDGDPRASRPTGEFGLGQLKPIAARDVGDAGVPGDPGAQIEQMARFFALQLRRAGGNRVEALRAWKEGFEGKDQSALQARRADAYAASVLQLINVYER